MANGATANFETAGGLQIGSLSMASSATLDLSVGNTLTTTGAAGFAGTLVVTGSQLRRRTI